MAVKGFLKASGTPRRTFSTSVAGSRGGDLFAGLRVDAWPARAANGIDSHRTPSVKRVVVIDRSPVLSSTLIQTQRLAGSGLACSKSVYALASAIRTLRLRSERATPRIPAPRGAAPDHFFWISLSSSKVGQ